MRVYATNSMGTTGAAQTRRAATAGSFSLTAGESTPPPAQSGAPRAIASLDLIVALQGFDDPAERRRRAVRHGRTALDALDALKAGLLAGTLDRDALVRLKAMSESLEEPSGDDRLDAILAEIGLRAAVELAKFSK